MNDNDIVVSALPFKIVDAVPDRFLSGISAGHDPFEFVNVELFGISPDNVVPPVDAYYFDGVDLGMLLKALKRIDEDRFVIDIYELLGDILPHSVTGPACYNDRYIHFTHSL